MTIQNRILENIDAKRTRSFRSRPDLAPPFLTVNTARPGIAPGHLFLSPKSKKDQKQAGPMIADNSGQPIWFLPLPGIDAATDFRAQTYRGKPVLTYWRGTSRQGIGVGEMLILDQSYRVIHRIRTPNGFRPDLHELVLTPRGTAVLITYPIVRANLRPVKGARRGLVVDSVIQEIDVATGLVTFEWHSLGNIALRETFSKPMPSPRAPFDYAHANSVNLDARRRLPDVRAQHVDRLQDRSRDGQDPLAPRRQARATSGSPRPRASPGSTTPTGAPTARSPCSTTPPSRPCASSRARWRCGSTRRARPRSLLSATAHPRKLLAATQGNQQTLPNGNFLVGWGSQRQLTEFDAAGNAAVQRVPVARLRVLPHLPHAVGRAAADAARRSSAADEPGAGTDAYMSWNGATEVATWELFAGSSASSLRSVATAPRRGFETKITAPGVPRFVQVRARNAAGEILSTSAPTRVTR